ncbi:hypothetical protein GPALN_006182 [Globodera pallida]|nr:hypothetical protein GPALN_006182 [Globodera pallida]
MGGQCDVKLYSRSQTTKYLQMRFYTAGFSEHTCSASVCNDFNAHPTSSDDEDKIVQHPKIEILVAEKDTFFASAPSKGRSHRFLRDGRAENDQNIYRRTA